MNNKILKINLAIQPNGGNKYQICFMKYQFGLLNVKRVSTLKRSVYYRFMESFSNSVAINVASFDSNTESAMQVTRVNKAKEHVEVEFIVRLWFNEFLLRYHF